MHPDIPRVIAFAIVAVLIGVLFSLSPLPSIEPVVLTVNTICIFGQYPLKDSICHFFLTFVIYSEYFAIIPLFQLNVDFWPLGCFAPIDFRYKFVIGICTTLFVVLPISVSNVGWRWRHKNCIFINIYFPIY
jgi:hypothetical protein